MMLSYRPLSAKTWDDFETLFGKHKGVRGGCWCMFHRIRSSEFTRMSRDERRAAQCALAQQGKGCGIIIYEDDHPIAWCQVGPAEQLIQFDHNRIYSKLNIPSHLQPQWRIACLFVDKDRRKEHLSSITLDFALDYILQHGGGIVEAFPMQSGKTGRPAYTGSMEMYQKRGFEKVVMVGMNTWLMRLDISFHST